MRNRLVIFIIAVAILLTACYAYTKPINFGMVASRNNEVEKEAEELGKELAGPNPVQDFQQNVKQLSAGKSSKEYIDEIIGNYTRLWADAVNNHKFSLVEPYLIPGSTLYNSQRNLLEFLYKHEVREEFVQSRILGYSHPGENGVYKVSVYEEYNIIYKNGKKENKGYNWIYTVDSDPFWGLSGIESDASRKITQQASTEKGKERDTSTVNKALLGHWVSENYYIETLSDLENSNGSKEVKHSLNPIDLFFSENMLLTIQNNVKFERFYDLGRVRGKAFTLKLNDNTHYIMYFSPNKKVLTALQVNSQEPDRTGYVCTIKTRFFYVNEKQGDG